VLRAYGDKENSVSSESLRTIREGDYREQRRIRRVREIRHYVFCLLGLGINQFACLLIRASGRTTSLLWAGREYFQQRLQFIRLIRERFQRYTWIELNDYDFLEVGHDNRGRAG
jgi:hypothetical protein